MAPSPVLIVGAGPSGLVAALTLLKNSIPVRIIEKDTAFHEGSRGSGIHPKTLEVLQNLGVADLMGEVSFIFPTMKLYKTPENVEAVRTWTIVEMIEPTPSCPWPSGYGVGQNLFEEVMRAKIAEFGVHVELGMELVSIEQDQDGVTAHVHRHQGSAVINLDIRASYVIGTDGAKGVTRKLMNLTFVGQTRDAERMIVGDVKVSGIDTDWWHMFMSDNPKNGSNFTVLLRPCYPHTSKKVFNYLLLGKQLDITQYNSPSDVEKLFYKITNRTDLTFGKWSWFSHFRPNMRMVDKFGEGRVFVAGDAAHVHSLVGAQGLNSSIQDSFNLAWKISLVYKGQASPSLLETYTDERLPVIADMLRRTSELHTNAMNSRSSDHADEKNPWTRSSALFMLGINYRWSGIVHEERTALDKVKDRELMKDRSYGGYTDSVLCAGDRAPDAPLVKVSGEDTTLFKLFDTAKHAVIIFTSDDQAEEEKRVKEVQEVLAGLPKGTTQVIVVSDQGKINLSGVDHTVIDRDCLAASSYLVENEKVIVIIRPDTYIGAIVKGASGVKKYFSLIFN